MSYGIKGKETNDQELSARELEILSLVATGASNQQIAQTLYISLNTVKTHLRNIYYKLQVESRTEASLVAIQRGLVAVEMPGQAPAVAEPAEPVTLDSVAEQMLSGARAAQPLGLVRRVALIGALLLAALVLFWPGPRSAGADQAPPSRLFDRPSASVAQGEQATLSRWRDLAQMPGPSGRFAQAEVGGLIYVIGGSTPDGVTDAVRVYDVSRDVWDHRSPKPTAAANIGAAVVDGRIFVPGGLGQDGQLSARLAIYDPETDQWSEGPPLPAALCAYAIVAYGRGFYVLGGWDGQSYLDTVYFYDVESQAWRLEGRMPTPRGFAAAALVGERILVVGGYDGRSETRTLESFDPALLQEGREAWRTHAPMRVGRAGHVAVSVLGHLYVLGGGWEQPFAKNERYDMANDVWSTFDSPIVGEWRTLGASRIDTGAGTFIYTIGGWGGGYLGAVRAYQAFFRIYLP